ncbi:MAG: hypothetical protein KDC28_11590 [Saprospiraceae bacterium]|nr:hypothetical protein [Saprospiraceae bacterium]MCB9318933.1 hypothetical protein [Lewinellaceae bacterium]
MKSLNTTWIVRYGMRWKRLFVFPAGEYRHFYLYRTNKSPFRRLGYWMVDVVILVGDVLCLPEIYLALEWLASPVKTFPQMDGSKYRVPYPADLKTDNIRLHLNPRIRPNARVHAYVSFQTINFWGELSDEIFLHELMHIWQFHRVGSIYIHHALRAQRMIPAYEYGLVSGVLNRWDQVCIWRDFNFEQMASLGADLELHLRDFPEDSRAKAILDQFF